MRVGCVKLKLVARVSLEVEFLQPLGEKYKLKSAQNHCNLKIPCSETSILLRAPLERLCPQLHIGMAGRAIKKRASGPSPFSDRAPCLSMDISSKRVFSGIACVTGGHRVGMSWAFEDDVLRWKGR